MTTNQRMCSYTLRYRRYHQPRPALPQILKRQYLYKVKHQIVTFIEHTRFYTSRTHTLTQHAWQDNLIVDSPCEAHVICHVSDKMFGTINPPVFFFPFSVVCADTSKMRNIKTLGLKNLLQYGRIMIHKSLQRYPRNNKEYIQTRKTMKIQIL